MPPGQTCHAGKRPLIGGDYVAFAVASSQSLKVSGASEPRLYLSAVMPAQAGIQLPLPKLDPGLRRGDGLWGTMIRRRLNLVYVAFAVASSQSLNVSGASEPRLYFSAVMPAQAGIQLPFARAASRPSPG